MLYMRIVLLVLPSLATAIAAWYYFRGRRRLRAESELPTPKPGNGDARGGIEAAAHLLEPAPTPPPIAPSRYVEHPQQAVEDKKSAIDTTGTQETSPPPVRETGITAIEDGPVVYAQGLPSVKPEPGRHQSAFLRSSAGGGDASGS